MMMHSLTLCALYVGFVISVLIGPCTSSLTAPQTVCRGLPNYNCSCNVVGDLHEAGWLDSNADVPAKAEGLELTPVHNGTFNITWRPPQAIQDVRGFVVMLRYNARVRYFYFNMSYYIMNQYPEEQMRTSDIQMGLVDVDPFQLFGIHVLGQVDAEVNVSIISMPGFNIQVLPSVNKSIIVQRTGEQWQTHINITHLPNDTIQGCFNLAPASLNISSYTVEINKGMIPVLHKIHNITEEDFRMGQTCTKFYIDKTGNFDFRMKPNRCEGRCIHSRQDFNFTVIADRNDCINVTCQHGGTCQDQLESYTCQCSPRFTGTHCEQSIDQCESSPCSSGSTCVDGEDSFTCACHIGFTGELCDKNVDDCINNPCMHGECIDNHDSYKCECHIGWTGKHCEMIHAMILVFVMLSVIMVTAVVVLIVSIRTGRQQIIIIFASCRPSYEKNVNLMRRFLISKYNCNIQLTHTFDDVEKNWKKYHQTLIILSSEIDEGISKKLSDFKQQGEIHNHDIPYKLLAFKKANVKQFNNQQVIQIPSDLHHFKHILPNKMWPVSMFTNWRARSILSTMISSIYEEEDDDNVSSWKEIAVQCEQFRSLNADDLDGMIDCVSLEICGVDKEAYTPDTLNVNKHDIVFNPVDIDV